MPVTRTEMVAATSFKLFTYTCTLENLEECWLTLHELVLHQMSWAFIKPHLINIKHIKMRSRKKSKIKWLNLVKKGVRTEM